MQVFYLEDVNLKKLLFGLFKKKNDPESVKVNGLSRSSQSEMKKCLHWVLKQELSYSGLYAFVKFYHWIKKLLLIDIPSPIREVSPIDEQIFPVF